MAHIGICKFQTTPTGDASLHDVCTNVGPAENPCKLDQRTQRVHVVTLHILRAQKGSNLTALWPKLHGPLGFRVSHTVASHG